MQESNREAIEAVMTHINRVWLDGQLEALAPMLHPDIVMALPGFTGRIVGRNEFLAGFHDFCDNAIIHHFEEHDRQVDVAAGTAVVAFRYDMMYERSGERYHSTGRDLWVFHYSGAGWVAVWRTMLELQEEAA